MQKSHLHSPVCHKAITLTHLLCLTHTQMVVHFLDRHTKCQEGYEGTLKRGIQHCTTSLSPEVILVQLAMLSSLNH